MLLVLPSESCSKKMDIIECCPDKTRGEHGETLRHVQELAEKFEGWTPFRTPADLLSGQFPNSSQTAVGISTRRAIAAPSSGLVEEISTLSGDSVIP